MFEPNYCGLCNHDYLCTAEGRVIHFISLSSTVYSNKVLGRYETKLLYHTKCFLNNVTFVIRCVIHVSVKTFLTDILFLIDLEICPML